MNAILTEGLREVNTSRKFFTGSTWKTNNGGIVKVLGQIDRVYKNAKSTIYPYFLIEFEDGTQTVTRRNQLAKGTVKNLNEKNVCGVGYLGYGPHLAWKNGKDTREYKTWNHMLRRCYSEKALAKRPTYKGCSVDKRWHNFQNFCEDLPNLPGYERWIKNENKDMELDKDIRVKGNRVYGPTTCMFVTKAENIIAASLTGFIYKAQRVSDGFIYLFENQSEFQREHNITCRKITKAIAEDRIIEGWKISVEESK